ncbi:methylenetetrahydrofolate reductase, partial [Pseudonocardia sp. ICBG601]|uniref:methylenetetrahydrofolate reductase n=1 Tax=Pseudonocardia sp. ICBG601 TaxID=2846759 RepID=UPI0035AB950B
MIGSLAAAGVRNIMALRGDPPGDPARRVGSPPRGARVRRPARRADQRSGPFCVGVAA